MLRGLCLAVSAVVVVLACSGSGREFDTADAGAGGSGGSPTGGGTGGDGGSGGSDQTGGDAGAGAGALANGQPCSADEACRSGYCRDQVCCAGDCRGSCRACVEIYTGEADGSCELVQAGLDPRSDCTEATPESCGDDGSCDGAGACRKYGSNQVCAQAGCSNTTFTAARICDGAGECAAATPMDCDPNPCSPSGCAAPCSGDAQCAAQNYCAGGVCTAQKTDGETCTLPNECRSGNCVDGVCCDLPCDGTCAACSEAKTGQASGRCSAIPVQQDPDQECAADASNACGLDGTCDGNKACRIASSGTPCGNASCSGSTLTPAGSCDGQSGCTPSSPRACPGGLNCASATACTSSCANSTECAVGNYCSTGTCLPKKGSGVACGAAGECASGYCVDNVCCASACSLSCQGCSNAATGLPNGTCGPRGGSATVPCPSSNPTTCVNPQTDANNCNGCGLLCTGSGIANTHPVCAAGSCGSVCNNPDQQICTATATSCATAFWTFTGGDKGVWNNTNETSSEVATNFGRTDQWSLRLYASFNATYPAMAFASYFCADGTLDGTFDLRGKRLTAYVYLDGDYGTYPARCRISAYNPAQLFTWVDNPPERSWFQLSATFGTQASAITQIGIECDLPEAWSDESGADPERWYIDDVRITN